MPHWQKRSLELPAQGLTKALTVGQLPALQMCPKVLYKARLLTKSFSYFTNSQLFTKSALLIFAKHLLPLLSSFDVSQSPQVVC